MCGDPVGTCVSATCRQDADCAEGMKCAQWVDVHGIGCGPGTPLLGCTTPQDECDSDADCEDAEGSTFCSGATGVRQCTAVPNVACGRPFLVEGTERMAALTRTSTWTNTAKLYPQPAFTCAMLEPLTEAQRHELGERWAELGLMEHASVAAFARFTLQLLHVGAPAVFVEDAQRAMADETRHAQDCFALACRYLGYAVGPGALSMHHALQETTLEDIVRLTVREGCIGETCAALEAAEAYEATIDLEVKAVLDRIRVEELRHAELAWRFVNWALTEGAPNNVTKARLHQIVAAEFSAAASDVASHPITRALVEPFDTMPHGIVPKQMLPEIRRRALLDVVLPCGESLLHSLITTSYSQITAPMPELIAKPVDVSLM